MERKIRVGAVSYLNTKPLLYGIQRSSLMSNIDLKIDYPAKIASMLLNDEIDLGLVPVAIIPQMKSYYINTDYCIASNGPIASVCLFSETPLEKVEKVLLDYQSRTSVLLAKILLKEYWNAQPELVDARDDFREHIREKVAGVVIGDRALEQRFQSKYIYDLGDAWKKLTNLPFVFAAWISNKKLDDVFVREFNNANAVGLHNLESVLKEIEYDKFDLHDYYTKFIKYTLDEKKMKGLDLFLKKLNGL
ncbi:MAG: menaquinone biosynthesis protein [Bacteroidetes bacterium]|nr:menaquinone biosynthesis protein [Bacteroidota bacterium]